MCHIMQQRVCALQRSFISAATICHDHYYKLLSIVRNRRWRPTSQATDKALHSHTHMYVQMSAGLLPRTQQAIRHQWWQHQIRISACGTTNNRFFYRIHTKCTILWGFNVNNMHFICIVNQNGIFSNDFMLIVLESFSDLWCKLILSNINWLISWLLAWHIVWVNVLYDIQCCICCFYGVEKVKAACDH